MNTSRTPSALEQLHADHQALFLACGYAAGLLGSVAKIGNDLFQLDPDESSITFIHPQTGNQFKVTVTEGLNLAKNALEASFKWIEKPPSAYFAASPVVGLDMANGPDQGSIWQFSQIHPWIKVAADSHPTEGNSDERGMLWACTFDRKVCLVHWSYIKTMEIYSHWMAKDIAPQPLPPVGEPS